MSTISTSLSSELDSADTASNEAGAAGGKTPARLGKSRLWVWFLVAFCVQISAWTAWITIASQHKVQEVPLVQPSSSVR